MLFSLNFYEKAKFSVYFVLKPIEKVQSVIFRSQNGQKYAFSNLSAIQSIFELETFLKKNLAPRKILHPILAAEFYKSPSRVYVHKCRALINKPTHLFLF